MSNDREILGDKIKRLRRKRGLTQSQLSDMAHLTRTTISKIESGKFNASMDLITRLIRPLGAELDIKEID